LAEALELRADIVVEVPEVVHSHLNSYTTLILTGHESLTVTFSPCPGEPIDVLPSDYPIGQPTRFATLLPGHRFAILEASSGEKGPFKTLAEGRLTRGESLTMTFRDNGEPVAELTLADWSAHASVEPSPTAGWGVPQNAIVFTIEGDRRDAPAAVFVTLAGTGVGRGYDTVAHSPGRYRNRLTWQWSDEAALPADPR
jgi:hypothetical protein